MKYLLLVPIIFLLGCVSEISDDIRVSYHRCLKMAINNNQRLELIKSCNKTFGVAFSKLIKETK